MMYFRLNSYELLNSFATDGVSIWTVDLLRRWDVMVDSFFWRDPEELLARLLLSAFSQPAERATCPQLPAECCSWLLPSSSYFSKMSVERVCAWKKVG